MWDAWDGEPVLWQVWALLLDHREFLISGLRVCITCHTIRLIVVIMRNLKISHSSRAWVPRTAKVTWVRLGIFDNSHILSGIWYHKHSWSGWFSGDLKNVYRNTCLTWSYGKKIILYVNFIILCRKINYQPWLVVVLLSHDMIISTKNKVFLYYY